MFFAWSIPAGSAAAPDSLPSVARDLLIWPVSTGAGGLTGDRPGIDRSSEARDGGAMIGQSALKWCRLGTALRTSLACDLAKSAQRALVSVRWRVHTFGRLGQLVSSQCSR